MLALLRSLNTWVDGALWRSWLIHTLGAIPLLYVVGPIPTVTFFVLREAEQAIHALMSGTHEPWHDYIADIGGPFLLACVWSVAGWPHWL